MDLLQFLRKSKESLGNLDKYEHIHIVIGNESCDLDSTVSAISLAYFLELQSSKRSESHLVIPIMNVSSKLFALRTETCYLLKECSIDSNLLVFKDQVDFEQILLKKNVETSMVDHHVLSDDEKMLEKTVVQILDHRPLNKKSICKNANKIAVTIRPVGSCCTLVTGEIIKSCQLSSFKELHHLLYATIIYDTIGLNKAHGKTTDEDVRTAEELEAVLKPTRSRESFFNVLWKVHNDVTGMTSKDLLFRDLKVARSVPVSGLPMLVQDYLKRKDVPCALAAFSEEYKTPAVVLVGIEAGGDVKRDIGIFFTDKEFKDGLISALNQDAFGSNLCLYQIPSPVDNVVCYKQLNAKLTRKFILPLVEEASRRFFNT